MTGGAAASVGAGASAGHSTRVVGLGRARELAETDRWAQVGSEGDARVDAGERGRGLSLTGGTCCQRHRASARRCLRREALAGGLGACWA